MNKAHRRTCSGQFRTAVNGCSFAMSLRNDGEESPSVAGHIEVPPRPLSLNGEEPKRDADFQRGRRPDWDSHHVPVSRHVEKLATVGTPLSRQPPPFETRVLALKTDSGAT